MTMPDWVPTGIALDRPSAARMYDYFLGGHHNFEVDRKAADAAAAVWPDMPLVMQANRAFLHRAVRFLTAQGIDQFLDIGSGIPTVGNVHEAAQETRPAARVVYVDEDPVAVAHSRAILRGNPHAAIVQADARRPERIFNAAETAHLLDLSKPLGVLVVALLHFIADDDEAYRMVRALRDAVAPGSYLAIAHASGENMSPETLDQLDRIYTRTPTPVTLRSRAAIGRFFDGLELVEPGLVFIPLWRPDAPDDLFVDEPERCPGYAGVGRNP
jgi:hypothetical protein